MPKSLILKDKRKSSDNKALKRRCIIEDVITKDIEKVEPCIVQFSNGVIRDDSLIEGRLYRNASEKHIRRKKERILKVSSTHLSYVGKNFGTEVINDFKERIFLGVLDKQTNKMKLIETSSFLLHPELSSVTPPSSKNESLSFAQLSYKDKRLKLSENFGGRRGRSHIRKTKENEFDIVDMSSALEEAMDTDVTALPEDVQMEDQSYLHVLPPCNRQSVTVCDVYSLKDIVTDEELVCFNEEAVTWLEEEQDTSSQSKLFQQTLAHAKLIPDSQDEERAKVVCVALFNECLLKLHNTHFKEKPQLGHCPKFIGNKIFSLFTEGVMRKKTKQLEDKLCSYIIILALIANKFEVELLTLSSVLGIKKDRLERLLKVIGATLKKDKGVVLLKLPLTKLFTKKMKKKERKF